MIGASKLNRKDVERIHELIKEGNNDYKIAREFVSESGQKVSREHILCIRHGKRWNSVKRSFMMKDEIEEDFPTVITLVGNDIFETQVGRVQTKTMDKWFFLTLINDNEVDGPEVCLTDKKPLRDDILTFHQKFIRSYL